MAQIVAAVLLAAIMELTAPPPAAAQYVCPGSSGLAMGSPDNLACGVSSAIGVDSANTAIGGALASASGDNSRNVANGAGARATGNNSHNVSIGGGNMFAEHTNSSGNGSRNIAVGFNANASGDGTNNVAVGANTVATGANASAFGNGAQAAFANSAAFGNGAVATRADQQMFGTASNTYTMAGINSTASQGAQSGPLSFVTSDSNGNLAGRTAAELGLASTGDITAINARLSDLGTRNDKAFTGVAMAFAMAGVPTLLPHERVAVTMNWGTFERQNGLAFNAAVRLDHHVQINAGIGYGANQNLIGGRVGMRMGW